MDNIDALDHVEHHRGGDGHSHEDGQANENQLGSNPPMIAVRLHRSTVPNRDGAGLVPEVMVSNDDGRHMWLSGVEAYRRLMTKIALEVVALRREYRSKAVLDGIDLSVSVGETVGILGSNGAGKSTLVETIAGLRRPSSGTVRVCGLDPWRDRARVRSILGVQLQDAVLHPDLTVLENVRLHRSFYRHGEQPDQLIQHLGLTDVARTRTQRLSGGQQQRLSIAVALIGRPRVVILDELTTGLDPEGRRSIWELIENIQANGATILLVSHSMDEVERLCDRVIVLDKGRILGAGTTRELRDQTGTAHLEDAFLKLRTQDTTPRRPA